MTLTETFVEWAWSLKPADLSPEAAGAIRRSLLDAWGCGLAAGRLAAAAPAVEAARSYGAGPVRVPGVEGGFTTAGAAFATGALVHALDFDDTHPAALVHASATVLPVLSAVGQEVGADAERLELAAAAGYELVTRLGLAVPHGFHARGLHATSVCGVFAAALVAARLLDLTDAEAIHALGIAGSAAAGSLEFLDAGSDTKMLHPALSAQAGLTAARLAAAGATGPATILEGRYGIFPSYLQVPAPVSIVEDLGARWETAAVTVKPYPCCHLSHATIDAVAALRLTPDQAGDVERIVVDLPASSVPIVAEPRAAKLAPTSPYAAKFSLPWTVAALLVDGAVDVDTFEGVGRPDIAALARRVDVEPIDFDGPPATAPGSVRVTRYDGSVRVSSVVPGPVSEEQLVAKFVANAGDPAAAQYARQVLTEGWKLP